VAKAATKSPRPKQAVHERQKPPRRG
jgi:hypothetical protein